MIILDTETCGLHSAAVLLQYAEDNGEIKLYNFWKNPIGETLSLIEWICSQDICGFNLTFDWYHLVKIYNLFAAFGDLDAIPEDYIDDIHNLQKVARDGLCLKPKRACDLMLHARKGPYQSTMDRKPIIIKRVPTKLAWQLAKELEQRVKLKDIYFARRADKHSDRWKVEDTDDINFKNIVLRFNASAALKVLAADALGEDPSKILLFADVEVPKQFWPEEFGFSPTHGNWNKVISYHISHWEHNQLARKYAAKDIELTRKLWEFFGCPEPGDNDSELACMAAAVRWKGFKVDIPKLKELKKEAIKKIEKVPIDHHAVKRWIYPDLSNDERLLLGGSTKKTNLELIATWNDHPAQIKAQQVLEARRYGKKNELYDKLIFAERFHVSVKIIGALSGRMSGSDGLNAQGIDHTIEVRQCFPLAQDGYVLCGGDFESFEVTIAEANYNDPRLRKDLLSGKKVHCIMGMMLYPGTTYDDITNSKGTKKDMYDAGKKGFFLVMYGGNAFTITDRLGVETSIAEKAFESLYLKYPNIRKEQKKVEEAFGSMRQPGGLGRKVIWNEPQEYIESMLGFRRYFTLENQIAKTLFDLAESPPEEWLALADKIVRRDREQLVGNAVRSALFGAAFGMQSKNIRAANNHRIQSTGAGITKHLQRRLWDLQPCGVHEYKIMPFNVHDEVLAPMKREIMPLARQVVHETVEHYRSVIPLIGMEWKEDLASWADK